MISSVTFTDQGHVLGTRFAHERGLLAQMTNNYLTYGDSDVLAVWDIDDNWKRLGAIPGCEEGIVSPDGQSVAVERDFFAGIELWPLPSPPTRVPAFLAAAAGLLAASFLWWLSGRSRCALESSKPA